MYTSQLFILATAAESAGNSDVLRLLKRLAIASRGTSDKLEEHFSQETTTDSSLGVLRREKFLSMKIIAKINKSFNEVSEPIP